MDIVKNARMANCKSDVALTSSSSDDDDFQLQSTSRKIPVPVQSPSKIVPLSVKKRFNFVSCPYGTNENQNLARHIKKHDKPSQRPNEFECEKCLYQTSKTSSWTKHLSCSKHQSLTGSSTGLVETTLACPELNCNFAAKRMETLYLHLSNKHQRTIEKDVISFENEETFKQSRNNLQTAEC
ncbi:unnamed protein product, partial [Allacma fusca]